MTYMSEYLPIGMAIVGGFLLHVVIDYFFNFRLELNNKFLTLSAYKEDKEVFKRMIDSKIENIALMLSKDHDNFRIIVTEKIGENAKDHIKIFEKLDECKTGINDILEQILNRLGNIEKHVK